MIDHRADAGRHGAADQRRYVHRHGIGNREAGLLRRHDVLAEDAELAHLVYLAARVVMQPHRAVEQPRSRRLVQIAELRLSAAASRTLPARRHKREDAAVARFELGDARTDSLDRARALVTQHRWQGERGRAFHDVVVRRANPGRVHLDQHLAVVRLVLSQVLDHQRRIRSFKYRSAHRSPSQSAQFGQG